MNRITAIGNLTRDPELRTTPNGVSVCQFTVAVQRPFSGQDGERVTDFLPVVVWRKLGENCSKYLAKGHKVAVSGPLQVRNYEDKNGVKRTAFEIVADDVEFLTPRGESGDASSRAPASSTPVDDFSGFTDMDDSQLPF